MKFFPRYFCLLTFYFLLQILSSQDIKYARKIVDTLASPSMHGRGYVNHGEKIAAKYLAGEFEKFKLKFWGQNYFQNFQLNINTFPGKMFVSIDGKQLRPGKDFIIGGTSAGKKGSFGIKNVSAADFTGSNSRKKSRVAFVIKENVQITPDCSNCLLLFIEKGKLIMDIATVSSRIPMLHISTTAFDSLSKKMKINIENKMIRDYPTQNVIGYIPGTQYPDSFIVFSAHYDHLGHMGKNIYFPGANDNASGCALMLNLASYYSQHPPEYSIAFMAFGAEEAGLLGSKYYVEHPLFPLKQIKFLINLDLLGTGDEGITVVNGAVFKPEFDEFVKINEGKKYLPQIKIRGKATNSDHYFFSENGVKCFFIYTLGGIKAYHDIYDKPETLPLTKFEDVFRLLTDFTEYLQK
ncbi:MAG: M28 family peptidase [Bacteroidetes bacterium]|nr:M28 family peptidase [Bacteroidota bacterium]